MKGRQPGQKIENPPPPNPGPADDSLYYSISDEKEQGKAVRQTLPIYLDYSTPVSG